MRLHAAQLQGAIDHLAATWLDCDESTGLDEVLDAYAADHLRQVNRIATSG
ncbi:MAG: hypothetical protein M3457_03825 [Chloroflexota bacterium]|nr:hypothetical protein [Chloroflexota bacterium]